MSGPSAHNATRRVEKDGNQPPNISSLLPKHIAAELDSPNMRMLHNASLLDPQQLAADDKITVDLDKIQAEHIILRCFKGKSYSSEQHTLLMCNTIYDIFTGDSSADVDAVRIFLQALIMIFGKQVLTSTSAAQKLLAAGIAYDLEEIDETSEAEVEELRQDEDTVECLKLLSVASLSNPQVVMMAYCGAILLLIGKQLTESSLTAWTGRRVRGLAASMGTTVETARVIQFSLTTACNIYQKLSMLVPIRAATVRVLFGMTGVGSAVASLSGAMLNLLAWSEMNHVRMVQDYLFGRFPEILSIKQLQGSTIGVLRSAWDYLGTLPERERPYAKLLYGPQKTKSLQREKFVLLTDAAHAVGTYLHTSMANYQGDTLGTAGSAVRKIVMDYLTSLDRTGNLMVQATQYTVTNRTVMDNVPKADRFYNQRVDAMDDAIASIMRE